MTTRPSAGPWVDEPVKLLTLPEVKKDENGKAVHCCYTLVLEMAHVHNCIFRNFNSVLQQGPYIASSSEPNYNAQDVKDFCFYVNAVVQTVNHHHHTEETSIFPQIEKAANQPGLCDAPQHQHTLFHDGMHILEKRTDVWQATPDQYSWTEMKKIIDDFLPAMVHHMNDEIDVFQAFETSLDSDKLQAAWDIGEKHAKAAGDMNILVNVFPVVLGGVDNTYEGGGHSFPPLPVWMPYAIKYWFGRQHAGAWRFLPCDLWGNTKPLAMLPENRVKAKTWVSSFL